MMGIMLPLAHRVPLCRVGTGDPFLSHFTAICWPLL